MLMAWGRDDKVGGLKARAGLILEAEAEVVSWAIGMLDAIAEGELLCGRLVNQLQVTAARCYICRVRVRA